VRAVSEALGQHLAGVSKAVGENCRTPRRSPHRNPTDTFAPPPDIFPTVPAQLESWASAMPINREPVFPELPANRTYRRHSPNDANDPLRTFGNTFLGLTEDRAGAGKENGAPRSGRRHCPIRNNQQVYIQPHAPYGPHCQARQAP